MDSISPLSSLDITSRLPFPKSIHTIMTSTPNVLGKRSHPDETDSAEQDSADRPSKRQCTTSLQKPSVSHYPPPLPSNTPTPWHHNDSYLSLLPSPHQFFTHILPSSPFNLSDIYPIHPLFYPLHNLSQSVPLLTPTLRLTTRLLTSRHTLPFIHNLFTAPITHLHAESMFYGTPIHHLPSSPYQHTGLPPFEHHLTIRTILSLSSRINIFFSADPRLEKTWAFTVRTIPPQLPLSTLMNRRRHDVRKAHAEPHNPLNSSPVPLQLPSHQISQLQSPTITPAVTNELDNDYQQLAQSLSLNGTHAQIHLSSTFLTTLHPSTHPRINDVTKLRAMFFMVVTLVHEITHAVWMCRFPAPFTCSDGDGDGGGACRLDLSGINEYEPFIGDERKSELGYSFEKSVFGGGVMMPLAQDAVRSRGEIRGIDGGIGGVREFEMGIGWLAWPDTKEFFVRAAGGGRVVPLARLADDGEIDGDGDGDRKVLTGKRWEEVRVVGHEFIVRLFRGEFWDRLESEGDKRLLEVGTEVGCWKENVDWGCVEGGVVVDWVDGVDDSDDDCEDDGAGC